MIATARASSKGAGLRCKGVRIAENHAGRIGSDNHQEQSDSPYAAAAGGQVVAGRRGFGVYQGVPPAAARDEGTKV